MRLRHGVVGAVGLALALSACSSTTSEPTTDASAGASEAASPAAEAVDLRWRTRPDNQAEADVYQGISD